MQSVSLQTYDNRPVAVEQVLSQQNCALGPTGVSLKPLSSHTGAPLFRHEVGFSPKTKKERVLTSACAPHCEFAIGFSMLVACIIKSNERPESASHLCHDLGNCGA